MSQDNIEFVLKSAKEHGVKFIRLWFVDILGFLKSFSITYEELEHTLVEGTGFDGSSIEGFVRVEESDMIAKPDPTTFQILPWRPKENAVARMFCDILTPDNLPFQGDPRYILKKILKKVNKMGYTFYTGPELEFFYFKKDSNPPECLDNGGYFDLTPQDVSTELRRETVLTLENMGIPVQYSHHEIAPSQHKIALRYADALTMADNAITYKLVVKEVALKYGIHASFMPKPLTNQNGNGMHVHQSLFKGDTNIFFDPNDDFNLSTEAKYYIAGILKHVAEFTSITCQWVNSYKRLVPGYDAPTYISWARTNRSSLIRIPSYMPKKKEAARVELRSPDSACNPYLAFAVMLAAGIEGIKNKYSLPEPIEKNMFKADNRKKKRKKSETLPESLHEAIALTEKSKLVRETLGDDILSKFLANKKMEWEKFNQVVTSFELDNYLNIL